MAAYARALEHVNFALATLGMAMRLPVIRPLLQLIVDSSGGGPQAVAWRGLAGETGGCGCTSCPSPRPPRRVRLAAFGLIALGG